MTEQQLKCGGYDSGVLERFMKEFFPFNNFKKAGLFTKEMKGDYYAQAERICKYFGYETIYKYRSEETRCHLSLGGDRQGENIIKKMEKEYLKKMGIADIKTQLSNLRYLVS